MHPGGVPDRPPPHIRSPTLRIWRLPQSVSGCSGTLPGCASLKQAFRWSFPPFPRTTTGYLLATLRVGSPAGSGQAVQTPAADRRTAPHLSSNKATFTARAYTQACYPWFEYYAGELKAIDGSKTLAAVKTVPAKAEEKRAAPLPENETVSVTNIVNLRAGLKTNQVREVDFS